ncbi:MAG: hypothetical protein U5N85_23565 [Arcicella sp.]|nr:hypothetical protein [Arcicella sp.]
MKTKFLVSLLFFGQIAFGQTGKYIKVTGTKCSIIPPKSFLVSSTFSGFQNDEKGASIMINEIPAPYQQLIDGFTESALKTRGMTLINKKTVDFNASKATLFTVSQPANGSIYLKQMLIFGDSKTTILVNGIYPEKSKDIESEIKEALFSTIYSESQTENPLDAAKFTIETQETEFKVTKYLSGMLLYSIDGKIPTEKPTLTVGNSISKISPTVDRKTFALDRLKKLPQGENNIVKSSGEVTIDNMDGFEIVAEGKSKDGKPELIYQVILFDDNGDYYLILGQSAEDFQKYLEVFQKISKTFRRK